MNNSEVKTIVVSELSKNYGDVQAVCNVSFECTKGEIVALLGPNGAGKSTLINMLAGYLSPQSGSIKILQKDISEHPVFAKENIGFLPEGSPLYPDLCVQTSLNYMAALRGADKSAVATAVENAQITEVLKQKNETLSKGYQRRVGFAQSILGNPPILLLDEPTDGLDPNQKEYIRKLIRKMAKDKTILISTHLLEEAETVCNRIMIMNRGRIKIDGTLKDILHQTKCKNLAEAFHLLTQKEN